MKGKKRKKKQETAMEERRKKVTFRKHLETYSWEEEESPFGCIPVEGLPTPDL